MTRVRAEVLQPDHVESAVDGLADLLVDCVRGGASVGFLDPLSPVDAADFWRGAVHAPGTLTWVARDDAREIIGCVQLKRAQLPNGRHRGEVAKLLVHRRARRLGVARALLALVEEEARRVGVTLLLLDTESDSPAQALYERHGFEVVGTVADFALTPDGRLSGTTFMVKRLPA